MSESSSWQPVIAFDSDDPEFTRGFEAGVLWQAAESARLYPERLASGSDEMTIHAANAEMAMRILEHHRCWFRAEPLDGWLALTFGPERD